MFEPYPASPTGLYWITAQHIHLMGCSQPPDQHGGPARRLAAHRSSTWTSTAVLHAGPARQTSTAAWEIPPDSTEKWRLLQNSTSYSHISNLSTSDFRVEMRDGGVCQCQTSPPAPPPTPSNSPAARPSAALVVAVQDSRTLLLHLISPSWWRLLLGEMWAGGAGKEAGRRTY